MLACRRFGASGWKKPSGAGGIFSSCTSVANGTVLKDGFGIDEVDSKLLRDFFGGLRLEQILIGGVAEISELATIGLFSTCPLLLNPVDTCLGVWTGKGRWHSGIELELSVSQSLMASTIISLSLRIRSAPLEFLTGPMGAEMRGRLFFPRPRILFLLQQYLSRSKVLACVQAVVIKERNDCWIQARVSLAFSRSQRRENEKIKFQ